MINAIDEFSSRLSTLRDDVRVSVPTPRPRGDRKRVIVARTIQVARRYLCTLKYASPDTKLTTFDELITATKSMMNYDAHVVVTDNLYDDISIRDVAMKLTNTYEASCITWILPNGRVATQQRVNGPRSTTWYWEGAGANVNFSEGV